MLYLYLIRYLNENSILDYKTGTDGGISLTSVRITPLSVEISFDIPEPSDKFSCIHIDAATFPPLPGTPAMDYENVTLVMKDGTEISLFQSMGAKDVAILAADSPIVLEKVDYLQMSDGTKLHAK